MVIVSRKMLWAIKLRGAATEQVRFSDENLSDTTSSSIPLISRILITASIIALATLAAIVVPGLDVAFGLTGALTATVIMNVVPGILFLSLDADNVQLGISSTSRVIALFVVIYGIVMGITCACYILAESVL